MNDSNDTHNVYISSENLLMYDGLGMSLENSKKSKT